MKLRFVPNAWAEEDDAEDEARALSDAPPPAPIPGIAWRIAHLRLLLPVSAVMLIVAAVVGALTRGAVGAAGGALGVALVVFSYLLTTVFLAWVDAAAPPLIFPMGMTLYVTKFALFGMVIYRLAQAQWGGLIPLAVGVCFGIFGWTSAHIWWLQRHQPTPPVPPDPAVPAQSDGQDA